MENLQVALEFVIGLGIIIIFLRLISWLIQRFRFRTGVPLVFHPLSATDQQQVNDAKLFAGDDLVPKLIAYIAEDPPGTLVPGGLGASGPVTAAEEVGDKSDWAAMLLALAFARRPGYHVQFSVVDVKETSSKLEVPTSEWQKPKSQGAKVTVTIFRQPGGRVVAATTITKTWEELISHIGAFCVFQVGNQHAVRRRTPRWELWHSPEAYRLYREGLAERRHAIESQIRQFQAASELEMRSRDDQQVVAAAPKQPRDHEPTEYEEALARAEQRFMLAAQLDPANLLPPLARAAVLELLDTSERALPLYKACQRIWQEQVEIEYRIVALDPRHESRIAPTRRSSHVLEWLQEGSTAKPPQQRDDILYWLQDHQKKINSLLRRRQILWMWLRTWSPQHWAPGERRYWAGWFKPEHPRVPRYSMRTKRREYLTATHTVLIASAMWKIIQSVNEAERRFPANADNKSARHLTGRLFIELDRVLHDGEKQDENEETINEQDLYQALCRLFHPDPARNRRRRNVPGVKIPDKHRHATQLPVDPTVTQDLDDAIFVSPSDVTNVRPAKRIGWLAHFNAACCFSVAIDLGEGMRPWKCDTETWQEDCCRSALRQLIKVHRDPYSQLDTAWLWNDPDLEPLKRALREREAGDPLVELGRGIGLSL